MSSISQRSSDAAAASVLAAHASGRRIAELRVDGFRVQAAFTVDEVEAQRRSDAGLSAVTNTGLLHALWTLPEGEDLPLGVLDAIDADTLSTLGVGTVEIQAEVVRRTYRPVATVHAVACAGRSPHSLLRTLVAFPPIFDRFAVLSASQVLDTADLDSARAGGIGIVRYDGSTAEIVEAPAKVLGRPAVYRWWIAELAYRDYLANCDH